MRSWARHLAVAAALAGGAALTGCAEQVDSDQARICRSLLPPLHAPGARFEILRTSSGLESGSVRIVFRVREPGGPARIRFALCRFGGTGMSRARQDLVDVVTDSGRLSETSLFFLKRFYLGSGESALEDPGEGTGEADVPEVSPGLAYAVQQAVSGLPQTTVYGLLAASYSLVYGLVGRIVFGFGELAGVGGYAALLGIAGLLSGGASTGTAALLALPLAIVAAALHGAAAGRIVVAPLVRAGGLPVLIATTGLMIVLSEYMRLVQGADLRWAPPLLSGPLPLLRSGSFVATLTPMAVVSTVVMAGAAAVVLALLAWTSFGRSWRAYADDPRMAALLGVDIRRLFLLTFALSSALAGLAGFIITVHFGGVGYSAGLALGLKALVAAVLGGIGSVPGALLGGLALGLAESLWSATMPMESRDIAVYAVLSIVLALRPGGLFGFGELAPRRV